MLNFQNKSAVKFETLINIKLPVTLLKYNYSRYKNDVVTAISQNRRED